MNKKVIFWLAILMILFLADVVLGSVWISPLEIISNLFNLNEVSNTNHFIITQLRIPRALMAIITGAALSLAGLLMQSLFRNPLAGPFVLGISSGGGLGVALVVMAGGLLGIVTINSFTIISACIIGSLLVFSLIVLLSLRIKDTMGLLIVGLMVGSLSSAVIGILSYMTTSEQLQRYVFWSLGSLSNVSYIELAAITAVILVALAITIRHIKSLNVLLLGEDYARSLGVSLKKLKWYLIIATCLLAGSITAYAGPIAFIGLAVPHLARMVSRSSNYYKLIPLSLIIGSCLLLLCDMIAQLPFTNYTIPINAVTSLIGAPLVITLILKRRNLKF